MLSAILISVFFIIFPLFFYLNFAYIQKLNKILFSINLFNVKIFYGTISFNSNKILIRYNKKKIKIININKNLFNKNNINKFSGYHFYSVKTLTEIGLQNSNPLVFSILLSTVIIETIKNIIILKKPYFVLNNQINLYENEHKFNVFMQNCLIINLLTIFINLIKNFIRNLIYDKKRK